MLPAPSPSQVRAIDAAIYKIVEEDGLTEADVRKRHEITRTMENVLQHLLPGTVLFCVMQHLLPLILIVCSVELFSKEKEL